MNFEQFAAAWNSTFDPDPILPESLFSKLSKEACLLILSDTNPLHFEFLRAKMPILRYFDEFVLSYEVGALKPSAAIYRSAIESANCSPKECFFTDDREINIQGARDAGINAVLFINKTQLENDLDKIKRG